MFLSKESSQMNKDITENLRIVLDFLTASTPTEHLPICDAVFLFGSSKTDQIPKSGANLFKTGLAKKVVCSGKHAFHQSSGPFGFPTEAEWYADVLSKEGVSPEAIILDTESTNTLENVLFGISACHKQEFYPKSLILCPIPPLCCRSLATFRKQFPEIKVFGYTFEFPIENYLPPDRMKRVLGEFERFEEYAAKGDMVRIDVPKNVHISVDFLKSQQ